MRGGIKINRRNLIRNELLKLNYNIGSLGTLYLIEIIAYLSSKEDYLQYMKSLERTTYSVIAKRFNVNVETLKSNIRKASATANKSENKRVSMVLTPKTVTSYVLEKITKDQN